MDRNDFSMEAWDEFLDESNITAERMAQINVLVMMGTSKEEAGLVDDDERYAYDALKAELDETVLPSGVMWDIPYDL